MPQLRPCRHGSLCNRFGEQGSRFSSESIWNRFGEYGSKFSGSSPWNKFATDSPVVVDRDGVFYGYFAANKAHPERTKIGKFRSLLDNVELVNEDLQAARDLFCGE